MLLMGTKFETQDVYTMGYMNLTEHNLFILTFIAMYFEGCSGILF